MSRSQHAEEQILLDHFAGKRGGYLVDVGAYDGVTWSNTATLLLEHGWGGVLVEPLPAHAEMCRQHYAGRRDVIVIEAAAGMDEECAFLHPCEMVTTLSESWRDWQRANVSHVRYGKPVAVRVAPLAMLLEEVQAPRRIDLLSIDCEGFDDQVIKGMDWIKYDVCTVVVEYGRASDVELLMRGLGYREIGRTPDNLIFTK